MRVDLAYLSLPRTHDGRIVLAVDVSPWLRSDAATSAERLFCHVYGRAKSASQFIPSWPYSFVVALESGRTSWTAMLDAVRLRPADDATAVTADQLRAVVARLIAAGHWTDGDPNILIVMDSGYDVTRLAFVLADLPVEVLGRIRPDRVLRLPRPSRLPAPTADRPSTDVSSPWPNPPPGRNPSTPRPPRPRATASRGPAVGTGCIPDSPTARAGSTTTVNSRSSRAHCCVFRSTTCPVTAILTQYGCGPRR